jgi:SAM-dependent methyltransferase
LLRKSKLSKIIAVFQIRNNRSVWEDPDMVKSYLQYLELQKPEEVIIEKLKGGEVLQSARLLDIGVGLGRTTFHIAPLVKEYVAIDYSENMIKYAKYVLKRRLKLFLPLILSDARFLPFKTGIFDIVLFSYNGLDYASPEERIVILHEVRRVLKEGGYFIFSSHNLCSIPKLLSYEKCSSSIYLKLKNILFRILNRSALKDYDTKDFALLYDGSGYWRLKTYYIKPIKQIKQLIDVGFQDIHIFGLNGKELTPKELSQNSDPWLYYLCKLHRYANNTCKVPEHHALC